MRTSERRDLKRCPARWHWAWREGLRPLHTKNPLWFGIGVHEALAEWYQPGLKRGKHPAESWLEYCASEERYLPTDFEDDGVKYIEARDLGEAMLNDYVDFYGKDDQWDVIATERTFSVLVPHPMRMIRQRRAALLNYVGTWDGVYRDLATGKLWLMEHKTAAAIKTDHLPLDDQAGSYFWSATRVLRKEGLLKPKDRLEGIMYNFLGKTMADIRDRDEFGQARNRPQKKHFIEAIIAEDNSYDPKRLEKLKVADLQDLSKTLGIGKVFGEISAQQHIDRFLREPVWRSSAASRKMLERIQAEGLMRERFDSGEQPLFKTPTRDCKWDCNFYNLCMIDEEGDPEQTKEYKQLAYTTQDLYSDHNNRKAA